MRWANEALTRPRPPRTLRPDERDLWQAVARSTTPMPGRLPRALEPKSGDVESPVLRPATAAPGKAGAAPPPPPARFRIGERADNTAAALPMPAAPAPRMDARALGRLSRGKLAPEARLDLHGLTLAEAQQALARFVQGSHAAGRRLLLVITGKGRGGAGLPADTLRRPGALRREVPLWLTRAPLSAMVLQVVPAHRRHGGDGAWYVYLSRRR